MSAAEQLPLGELVVVESTARFSPCGLYRYSLTRRWADGPTVAFVGPWDMNLQHISAHAAMSTAIVCAWGASPGPLPARPEQVLGRVAHSGRAVVALALTKHGQPRHPLYVRGDVEPIPYPKEPTDGSC